MEVFTRCIGTLRIHESPARALPMQRCNTSPPPPPEAQVTASHYRRPTGGLKWNGGLDTHHHFSVYRITDVDRG